MLQEVVELFCVRAQSLGLEVTSFRMRHLSLEADDISVLDFTLGEGVRWLHEFDHARFDLLRNDAESARAVGESPLFATS